MSPDEFQEAWRAESSRTRVSIDSDALHKQVQMARQDFRSTILWRDFREVGVAVVMIPLWFYLGSRTAAPWTWYLTVPALLWVIGFMVVDRVRHRQKAGSPGDSLLESARDSLAQVSHQIWLLRNVFWWYLLPFALSISAFFIQVSLQAATHWTEALGATAIMIGGLLALYFGVYAFNQYAVRKQLEPRRQELLALVESLSGENVDAVQGAYPILMGAGRVSCSPRRALIGNILAVVLLVIGVPVILNFAVGLGGDEFPKLAPFTDVRWGGERPVVEINGEMHVLFAIDGIDVEEIVAYCQKTYPNKWQKRFAEDLVEVMSGMGHPPGATVQLDVLVVTPPPERTTKEVAMTAANRRAVRSAAEKQEETQEHLDDIEKRLEEREQQGMDGSKNSEGPDGGDSLEETLETVRASYKLPAMAAFALRDGAIIEQATVGTRSLSDNTPVGADAQWHLGSNTKAMTATVAGMLVEEGLLAWDSTIGEVLGEAAPEMNPAHRDTTLAQLLHHTAGITPNIGWFSAPEDRIACAAEILQGAPKGKRGTYTYSNAGYVVAGAMMEAVTGTTWEELIEERLFTPLGMSHTGFGPPTGPSAPWGHESGLFRWNPKDPASRSADNPPVLGPAGTVHSTLEDYARFIAVHLAGAQGKGGIVTAETFSILHEPDQGDYAMGWIVTERGWAGGRALTHGGSNTMWFATVWLAPEKGMAFFAVTNAGGNTAFKAVDEVVGKMIGRHLE